MGAAIMVEEQIFLFERSHVKVECTCSAKELHVL